MSQGSFSARRPATNDLPSLPLPIPPEVPRVTSEGISPLSGGPSSSSQSSTTTAGLSSYYAAGTHGSWPTPNSNSYTFSSANQPQQPSHSQNGGHPSYASRPPFNSSLSPYLSRNSHSPAPYDADHGQYHQSSTLSASNGTAPTPSGLPATLTPTLPTHHSSLLSTTLASHQPSTLPSVLPTHQTTALNSSVPSHQPPTLTSSLSSHPPTQAPAMLQSQAPSSSHQQSSLAAPSGQSYRQSRTTPTTAYYGGASASQASSYLAYAPNAQSPHPTHHGSLAGAATSRGASGMAPPLAYRDYHGPYAPQGHVPGMGSIMTNLNNPGGQMSLIAGFGGAHVPHPNMHAHAHMYGQGGPQALLQERPFRCDQCPQSFNRNHDLKRHKRIHLSVKPFPCTYCEKSFSRKDALKRHRLVKGCDSNLARAHSVDPVNNDGANGDTSG